MATTPKKVLLRTIAGALHPGYLHSTRIVTPALTVELLDLEGRILSIPLADVRTIAWVRDFNLADPDDPERLTRRTFLARPRAEGLWLRMTLLGAPTLEGLAAPDLTLLDTLLADRGLYLMPPDIRSNTQRLFIPHHTILTLQVLAVITTPSKPKPATPAAPQPTLFE